MKSILRSTALLTLSTVIAFSSAAWADDTSSTPTHPAAPDRLVHRIPRIRRIRPPARPTKAAPAPPAPRSRPRRETRRQPISRFPTALRTRLPSRRTRSTRSTTRAPNLRQPTRLLRAAWTTNRTSGLVFQRVSPEMGRPVFFSFPKDGIRGGGRRGPRYQSEFGPAGTGILSRCATAGSSSCRKLSGISAGAYRGSNCSLTSTNWRRHSM